MSISIIKLRAHPQWAPVAAAWFHEKWGVPREAYEASMEACLRNESAVPQWYLALDGEQIVGGLGVIENDFHDRPDLTPNVCAVYVEASHRCRGIAGQLLGFVCQDLCVLGVDTLYLLTDHTSFYERYGWKFHCMVRGGGEEVSSRMYIHRM